MGDLYTRLTDLCKRKGVSGYKFCKDTKLQPSLLTDLKVGRQQNVSAKKAATIASYFGVSADYILYGEEKEKPVTTADDGLDLSALTEEKREIIQKVLQMDSQSLSAVSPLIESVLFSQQARKKSEGTITL